MSYDGRALSLALEKHKEIISDHQAELSRRRAVLYELVPRLSEIASEMSSSIIRYIRLSLDSEADMSESLDSIRYENIALQEERGRLLEEQGFPPDYLTAGYFCEKCADTGYVGSDLCDCLREIYIGELTSELKLLTGVSSGFDGFDLNVYSDEINRKAAMSPRDNMRYIVNICKTFAKNLNGNLLFMGSSGVGKSYTAGVVAIEAASRGVHVMYESACTLLVRFDDERFSQSPEEREGSRQQNCDLFILDDLGTENASPYAISRLYELINYRLLRNFPSIVITGLAHDELRRKYSPALLSRLLGSYTTLLFFGPDLRKSYNEMRG